MDRAGSFATIRVEFFSFLDYSLPQILFIVEALIIHWQDMDTSNPAVFVNAEFLKEHVGRSLFKQKLGPILAIHLMLLAMTRFADWQMVTISTCLSEEWRDRML
ncbi:hypothetical protein HAX54_001127 [Datura stramonium]|uniref:Uncharacterized protein n=1 Tax=Datura stramonium TaxID=4076 RepID=A0ABS8RT05_DATST|nr:hypothetical protein [Datura stramonium]